MNFGRAILLGGNEEEKIAIAEEVNLKVMLLLFFGN